MRIRHTTAATAAGLLAALLALGGCTPDTDHPATRSSANGPAAQRKNPGGYGGLLIGERWKIQWVTVDGRSTSAPPNAAAWLEFGQDGAVRGSDGCHPLLRPARITADALSVEPAPRTYSDRECEPAQQAFRDRFRKLFTGRLTISKRADDLTMDLKNEHGDHIAVKFSRPEDMFGTRYRLSYSQYGDSPGPEYAAGAQLWFRFHADGRVDGKLGCDEFTGRAVFEGERVAVGPLTLTTNRTCSDQVMRDEQTLLKRFPDTFRWSALRGSLRLEQDIDESLQLVSHQFQAIPG
jgi:heat shock protein HslJ